MKRINMIENGKVIVISGKSYAGNKQEIILEEGEKVFTPFGIFKIKLDECKE